MGNCVTTLSLSEDVTASLKANPDINHLLSLQLHYSSYDKKSQKIIDECTQIALTTSLNIEVQQHQQ
jgi:hypothetical protein